MEVEVERVQTMVEVEESGDMVEIENERVKNSGS